MPKDYEELDVEYGSVSLLVHGTESEIDPDCRVDLFEGDKNGARSLWISIVDEDIYDVDFGIGGGEWMTPAKARRLGNALIALSKRDPKVRK